MKTLLCAVYIKWQLSEGIISLWELHKKALANFHPVFIFFTLSILIVVGIWGLAIQDEKELNRYPKKHLRQFDRIK